MLLASIALFTLATIGSMSSNGNLQVSEALAGGTCCPDEGTCFPTGCSTLDCSVADSYWRSDGLKCSAASVEEIEPGGASATNR